MLTIFRRHLVSCRHKNKGRTWRQCQCPISVEGFLGDKRIRQSLEVRSWEIAQERVRELEAQTLFPEEKKPELVTIEKAVAKFFEDARARKLAEATLSKYDVLLEKQLKPFAKTKGFKFLAELDADSMGEFRATWKDAALSGYKKGERLRAFFAFCFHRKYIPENPVARMRPPKLTATRIKTFTPDEMEKIMWACELFPTNGPYGDGNRTRIKAFVLVLRYTGLRIRDVVMLEKERVAESRLFLYTGKTGTGVFLPLPDAVLDALKSVPDLGRYYFWTGNGLPKSAVSDWQRSIRRLLSLAGLKGNPHMWRHSFATDLLSKGVSVETVATLLGNTPHIVQKHYSHWVKSRQLALETDIKKLWQ